MNGRSSRKTVLESARRSDNRQFTVALMPGATRGVLETRVDDEGRELPPRRFAPIVQRFVLDRVARDAEPCRRPS